MSLAPITAALPVLVVLATFVLALAVDAFASSKTTATVAVLGLAAGAGLAVVSAAQPTVVVVGMATAQGTTAAVSALAFALTGLAIAGAWPRLTTAPGSGRVVVLLTGAAAAAAVTIAAKDMVLLVIGLETLALAGYALVSAAGTSRSDTAANTYFVQGAVAAGLLMLGTAGVVAISNSTFMPGLGEPFRDPAGAALTAVGLVFAALVFKVGGFPMHSWVPDAYETADPASAAYLASVPKMAALVVMGTLFAGGGASSRLIWAAAVVAAGSVAFGTMAGLRQTSYRRMLGYSAIAQTGFALTPLVAGDAALPAVVLMAVVYAVGTFGAFMTAEALESGGWDGTIKGMAGTGRNRPVLAVALTVCLLSLTGIPLTAGFWGKFVAFSTAANAGWAWLALVGLVGSVISFGYYGAVLRAVWLDGGHPAADAAPSEERDEDGGSPLAPPVATTAVVVIAAVAIVVVGVAPLFAGSGVFAFLGT